MAQHASSLHDMCWARAGVSWRSGAGSDLFRREDLNGRALMGSADQKPGCGSSEGTGDLSSAARQQAVTYSRTLRPCCRHVSTTLRIVATNRLPLALLLP